MLESEMDRLKDENERLHKITAKIKEMLLFDTYIEQTVSALVRELKENGYINKNILF